MHRNLTFLIFITLFTFSSVSAQLIKPKSFKFTYIQIPDYINNEGSLEYTASIDMAYIQTVRDRRREYRQAILTQELSYQKDYQSNEDLSTYKIDGKNLYFQPIYDEHSNENDFLVINGKTLGTQADLEIHASTRGMRSEIIKSPEHLTLTSIQYPVRLRIYSKQSLIMDTTISISERRFNYTLESLGGDKHRKKELDRVCEDLLAENMNIAYNLLNEEFGFFMKERQTVIYNIDHKRKLFNQYNYASELAKNGLKRLSVEALPAKDSVLKSIAIYYDYLERLKSDKKMSTFSDELTKATFFNLIECNLWVHKYDAAQKLIIELEEFYLTNDDLIKFNELKFLVLDNKNRFTNNYLSQKSH